MIASLLAAAAVAGGPVLLPPPQLRWMQDPSFCKSSQGMLQTDGPDPALLYRQTGKRLNQRLDQLPQANLYHTVLRSAGGCAITKPVAYSVGR